MSSFLSFEIGVVKTICVCGEVHRLGQFEIITVVNAGKIPGHVIDGDPTAWQRSGHFESLLFQTNRTVVVDTTTAPESKQRFDVGDFRHGFANAIDPHTFLHG